jgi:hypothetical protein
MGVVSSLTPSPKKYYMNLQHLIHKIEELKALHALYEQSSQGLASASALQLSLGPDASEDDQIKIEETVSALTGRRDGAVTLLLERTGGRDIDEAVSKIEEHLARLQHHQQIRNDQVVLRTKLDLELAVGTVPAETRQEVENNLQGMQLRLETLVRQGSDALAGPRLITLG